MIEALDLLKKDWQKLDNSFEQVSEASIYGMLHKKSSSIVKWILIISLIELGLGVVLSFLSFDMEMLKKIEDSDYGTFLETVTIFNYAVILFFVYRFYINYKKISTTKTTRQLMDDIISTRKTVKHYIFYNLMMVGISVLFAVLYAVDLNPKLDSITMNSKNIAIIGLLCALIIVGFVAVFWLFYRLIYGRLLRKLFVNYNELKKIDL
jgi:hypothetical protein